MRRPIHAAEATSGTDGSAATTGPGGSTESFRCERRRTPPSGLLSRTESISDARLGQDEQR